MLHENKRNHFLKIDKKNSPNLGRVKNFSFHKAMNTAASETLGGIQS
jgi:hypothetical protein